MQSILEDKKVRIIDILENIEKLNRLIALHKKETKSNLMVQQYQNLRQTFLLELKAIMSDFGIAVEIV